MLYVDEASLTEPQVNPTIADRKSTRNLTNLFLIYLFLLPCVFLAGVLLLKQSLHLDNLNTAIIGLSFYFAVACSLANRLASREASRINLLQSVLADFAHELASPLASAKSSIHSLGKAIADSETATEEIERLCLSYERLHSLLQDFRVLATWGVPVKHSELSFFNSGLLAKDCLNEIYPKCSDKGIKITLTERSSTVVIADKQAIARVLANLLGNAVKYCQPGAEISLVSSCTKNNVIYEIKDNGPGLAAEVIDRIFERHFRGTSNKSAGSGLGVSIAKEILESHGGKLKVEKAEPSGLRFIVQFPRTPSRHPFAQLFDK